MKKAVAVLAVLMVLSGALFAAEGRIGLSVSPAWKWYTGSSVNTGTTSIALMAEGANYFGDEGGFGLEYGLGTNIPINSWLGDYPADPISKTSFLFKAGLGYKYAFGDLFGLTAGLGVMGNIGSWTSNSSYFELDMYGSVGAELSILEFLGLNAGVTLSGPVYIGGSKHVASLSSMVEADKAFILAPYVIVSFLY